MLPWCTSWGAVNGKGGKQESLCYWYLDAHYTSWGSVYGKGRKKSESIDIHQRYQTSYAPCPSPPPFFFSFLIKKMWCHEPMSTVQRLSDSNNIFKWHLIRRFNQHKKLFPKFQLTAILHLQALQVIDDWFLGIDYAW